jgi:hypothetical protein
LETYTKLDLELEDGEDSRVLQLKLKALIFDTIYHTNIVKDLIANTVSSIDEWTWQKRARFVKSRLDLFRIFFSRLIPPLIVLIRARPDFTCLRQIRW